MLNHFCRDRNAAIRRHCSLTKPYGSIQRNPACCGATHFRLGAIITLAAVALAMADPPAQSAKHGLFQSKSPTSFAEAMDVLHHWTGPWRVTERHFDRMGKVVADTIGSEEGRWILEGHAVRRVYRSSGSDQPYQAEGTLTWSEPEGKFRGFWFDNRSTTGPSIVTAEWHADTHTMVHTVERVTSNGKTQTFRTVERFTDDDHRAATTYEIKGSELTKLIEVDYARTAPCPESRSGIRIIHDGLEPDGH